MVSEVAAALIGRDGELARLADLLGQSRRGSSTVAVIEGDAGIGKTALLQRLTAEAQTLGVIVVHGVRSCGARRRGPHQP